MVRSGRSAGELFVNGFVGPFGIYSGGEEHPADGIG